MKRLRNPIPYFGGKGHMGTTARILSFFPPHRHYVEPFGGGASVLLAKSPCGGVETYNDFDHALYEFFLTLADPAAFELFKRRVEALPYSRELWRECKATWGERTDRLERVWRWWVVARQSFGGMFAQSWGSSVTLANRKMASTNGSWLSAIEGLPAVHARLQSVQIENCDFRDCLKRYCGEGYLAYCDPPYVLSTRRDGGYQHEMSDDDHRDLVELFLQYDGMVVLSGYRNAVYEALEAAGWERHDWHTSCLAAGRTRASGLQGKNSARRTQPRTESVWLNPACQRALWQKDELLQLPT